MIDRKGIYPKSSGWVGRILAKIPARTPILYPLYLARQLYRRTWEFRTPELPPAFSGMRVVFLSDIHYGEFLDNDRVCKLIERVNAENADVILLGGDYGEEGQATLRFWQNTTACFRAREGVFGVLGNHDVIHSSFLPSIMEAMKERGVMLLSNQARYLEREGERIAIGGLEECYTGSPDMDTVERLCSGVPFVLLLSHSPDVLPDYIDTLPEEKQPFYHLFLCGHTHGGQIAIRGRALHSSSVYGNRYSTGMKEERGTAELISPGIGTSFLPVRMGTRPGYEVITLFSALKWELKKTGEENTAAVTEKP